MRTRITFPPFKEGHRYRLIVGGMTHVPSGEGYRFYVNGKLMKERNRGIGRREGGQPQGYVIDKAWWPDFENEVTIAAIGFIHNFGGKHASGVKRQHFSIWMQEAKSPPLPKESFALGRLLQPMRCTAWQATKDGNDMFLYDGKFVSDKAVVGQWTLVGQVADVAAFSSAATPAEVKDALITELTFGDDGFTSDERFGWSADTLMDVKERQALKMTIKGIDGTDYLFIESGGFSRKNRNTWTPDHPADWTPSLYVMKRK